MDRFQTMSVFVAVAEEESFARAARRLGMSPPAVTRAVSALEEHLGVKLLTRTTRYVRATDSGLRYLESTRRLLGEANEADEAVAGMHAAPRGQLSVTAPVMFGSMHVMPGIVDYLVRYPEVSVSAVFLDRVVNLVEEGLDVGVRIGELPDSTLRAIPVGLVRRVVCASPNYLAQHAKVKTPRDLAKHAVIASTAASAAVDWRFGSGKTSGGKLAAHYFVKLKPRLTTTNNEAAIQAALQGFGIARLMSYQVAEHVAGGRLKRILVADEPPPLPIHVLYREGRLASGKVRSFVDLLVERLRADKALR
jgi:DNA-binding transcriptional LysR family regulator